MERLPLERWFRLKLAEALVSNPRHGPLALSDMVDAHYPALVEHATGKRPGDWLWQKETEEQHEKAYGAKVSEYLVMTKNGKIVFSQAGWRRESGKITAGWSNRPHAERNSKN